MNPDPPLPPSFGKNTTLAENARIAPLVATIVALGGSSPVEPLPSSFTRIQEKLGHRRKFPSPSTCLAATGWAAALIMAAWLLTHRSADVNNTVTATDAASPATHPGPATSELIPVSAKKLLQDTKVLSAWPEVPPARRNAAVDGPVVISMQPNALVLPQNGGVAVAGSVRIPGAPVGPEPAPPDSGSQVQTLGELQATVGIEFTPGTISNGDTPIISQTNSIESPPNQRPSAGPDTHATLVYDPAADAGQLILKNLPPLGEAIVYRLYLTFAGETTPRFVGTVPSSEQMQDGVLRFSLTRKGWIPTASHLTYEASDQKPAFQPSFVVLQSM